MPDLLVDFSQSVNKKALFLVSAKHDFMYEIAHDEISMAFDIPEGETVICLKNERSHGTPRFRVRSNLAEIKELLDTEDYLEVMAEADVWNEGNPDLAIHPYLVMKSAIQNYKLDNGHVAVISVVNPWTVPQLLGGITQLDEKTKEFLEEKFGANPDQAGWVSGRNKPVPADHAQLVGFAPLR